MKRNKAPQYKNVEKIQTEIQKKLDEVLKKLKAMDRMSNLTGLDKYDQSYMNNEGKK